MEMLRRSGSTVAAAFFILTILLLAWTVSAGAVSKKDLRRVSNKGPVEVTVLYLNPLEKNPGEDLAFEVRMDTHAADIDGYRLDTLSVLQIDDGDEQQSLGWFKPGGGGHHISGVLKFKGPLPDNAKSLRLTIRYIGEIPERVFEWVLPIE